MPPNPIQIIKAPILNLIVALIVALIDPFKGNLILTIKAPILGIMGLGV